MSKSDSLTSAIDTCNADFIVLTETWLHPHFRDHEIFLSARHFSIYRCDRTTRQGGGVLLAISKNFPSQCVFIPCDLEIVWAVVEISNMKIILGVCYRPPRYLPIL